MENYRARLIDSKTDSEITSILLVNSNDILDAYVKAKSYWFSPYGEYEFKNPNNYRITTELENS